MDVIKTTDKVKIKVGSQKFNEIYSHANNIMDDDMCIHMDGGFKGAVTNGYVNFAKGFIEPYCEYAKIKL
jgi:hypothetical protein